MIIALLFIMERLGPVTLFKLYGIPYLVRAPTLFPGVVINAHVVCHSKLTNHWYRNCSSSLFKCLTRALGSCILLTFIILTQQSRIITVRNGHFFVVF